MSLRIIRAGVLDTIQDQGRYGSQHLGINPNGAMDRYSAQLANALLGKEPGAPVIELHFPSSKILFKKDAVIALCGADFQASINEKEIPMDHPVVIRRDTVLTFRKLRRGARCYLSVLNELHLNKWMNSYSTSLKTGSGGVGGRALSAGDEVFFKAMPALAGLLGIKDFTVLPWKANETVRYVNEVECIIGSEWYELTKEAQESFLAHWFQVTQEADRMGYRLAGQKLEVKMEEQLVSSAVSFGTVQLLPSGQLIILMADHQTTGGYPRIAHVISAHLPVLAQKKPADVLQFRLTDLAAAEQKWIQQQKYLEDIQNACKFRMESLFNSN
jgi:antagonist of KipI